MKVKGITESELYKAIHRLNKKHKTSVGINYGTVKRIGNFLQFSVRLASSKDPFYRRSHQGRRLVSVCFHGHKALYEEIFAINRDAVIVTAFARYAGMDDFLDKYLAVGIKNIGSQFHPLYMSEACDC